MAEGWWAVASCRGHTHVVSTSGDTAELIDDLVAARVALVPGRFFSPDDAPSQHLRACFATASPAEIALGMERLGMALKKRARAGGAHRPSLTRVRGAVHQNKRVRTQHALAT